MTITTRDELAAFPCRGPGVGYLTECCRDTTDECDAKDCAVLPIYRAHIALRAAVLGGMTGEEAAREYRHHAEECYSHRQSHMEERMRALADVVAKL